jgi:hypothetical protein
MTRNHYYKAKPRALTCGLSAALVLCATSSSIAQDVPSTAALEPTADVAAETPAASSAAPAAPADVAAEVTALRAVNELKARQEEADTAALLTDGSAEATSVIDPEALRVYGFMDFGLDKMFGGKNSGVAVVRPTTANTFVFGNLNLYFDATPVEHLRCLAEIRFTLAPHGEELQLGPPVGTSYQRTDTTAFDFASPSSQAQLRLGGLFIERAYSQYEFSKAITLQWGMFLNPFGIWNLDHGSPTLISLMLPAFISAQMVPTRLLGLHAFGSQFVGNSEIGYAVHVTNGRTPTDFDFTEDKALGGRVYWAQEGDFGRFVLGASGYWGTYNDQQRALDLTGTMVKIGLLETVAYTEEIAGLDVALDLGSLRVRSEGVLRWVKYEDGKSEHSIATDGTARYEPNRLEFSGYVLAAYRTPYRIEPYVEAELMYNKAAILPRWAGSGVYATPNVAALYLSAGVNVELTTHTQLKTQLVWNQSWDRDLKNKTGSVPLLFVRLVDSF